LNGKADQDVHLEARTCGVSGWSGWHDWGGAHTGEGGGFSFETAFTSSAFLRARVGSAVSAPVTVQQRVSVQLTDRPAGFFRIGVRGVHAFWRKRAILQRYDARRRVWIDVKTVTLHDYDAAPGSPFVYTQTDKFPARVPKGSLVRATVPLSQAKPCYLAGFSNLIQK
jgi:hypothetical protein